MLDMARKEQGADHVEDEQSLHAVEGDALPQFGAGQHPQAARLAECLAGRVEFDGQRRDRRHG